MGNRLLLVFLCFWTTFSFSAPVEISRETEIVCTTKLKAIDRLFSKGKKFSVVEQIEQWDREYNKLHNTSPGIFTHTTQVDVERIIREVNRNKNKLKTKEQQEQFIHSEMSWCIYYKH